MKKLKTFLKNFIITRKYPFMRYQYIRNKYFISTTWLDFIPATWRAIFGKQLCEDLKEAIKIAKKRSKQSKVTLFYIINITVIDGKLRFAALIGDSSITAILNKYEVLSACYCINCGSPVRYYYDQEKLYLCDKCMDKRLAKDITKTKLQRRKVKALYRLNKTSIKKMNNTSSVDLYKMRGVKE